MAASGPKPKPRSGLRGACVAALLLSAAAAAAQRDAAPADDTSLLRGVRDALVEAEDFDAALDPARRVAEMADSEPTDVAVSDIMRLARIQAELALFDEAELNYLEAIERLRESEGEFAQGLVPAYRALGRAYIGNRDFAAAIGALEQARHVSQRGSGLFNVEQSGVIDDMTLAYLGLGDTSRARDLQLERLANAVRQYGEDDLRTVPFRGHLADYYERSRMRLSARDEYARNLAVQEAAYGELDARLLPTLRALIRIDLALGEIGDVPERERIERILEADSGIAAGERSESLAVLGDVALVRGSAAEAEAEAAPYYRGAYAALAEESPVLAAEAFAEPRMLDFVAPLSSVDRAARNRPYAWGTVELTFDVTAAGRARNVRAVRVEPEARIAGDFVRRVRETHFRPRLVDGVAAPTRGVGFAHDFRYYVERPRD